MSLSEVQSRLAAHIRDPDSQPGPADVDDRRLKIYRDLFYGNIEGFVANSFPVLRAVLTDDHWHGLVRDFLVRHRCQSPYFLEISQEFLLYLQQTREPAPEDPPFMLELAHYEWTELGLDVAAEDPAAIACEPDGDLLAGLPVVSPLAWSLAYRFPVHRIGPDYRPEQPGEQPTFLIVYRERGDRVGFMETNAVTARLLELLQGAGVRSGREALSRLAEEIHHPQPEQLIGFGAELLEDLRTRDIILGSRPAGG